MIIMRLVTQDVVYGEAAVSLQDIRRIQLVVHVEEDLSKRTTMTCLL